MEELDEKGFVFLDDARRPYLCRIWGDAPWLFYWHAENHWVSYRNVTQSEVWNFPQNLNQEEQEVYHSQQKKWEEKLPI